MRYPQVFSTGVSTTAAVCFVLLCICGSVAADEVCPENCAECSTPSICITCQIGYYLTISNQCKECKVGCTRCEDDVNCSQCKNGYGLIGFGCGVCYDSKCLSCNGNLNFCKICSKGHSPNNEGRCIYKWSLLTGIAIFSLLMIFLIMLAFCCMKTREDINETGDDQSSADHRVPGGGVNENGEYNDVLPESVKRPTAGVYVSIMQNIGASSDREESNLDPASVNDRESFLGSVPNPFGQIVESRPKKKIFEEHSYPHTNPSNSDKKINLRERLAPDNS